MAWEAWATLAVVAAILYALVRNLAPPDLVLAGGVTVLMTFGAVSPRFPSAAQIAAAFGNESLLTVGVLFVVAAGLTETGAMTLLTERLLGAPRSVAGAQARLMLPVALVSAFLNNTPVVAIFMPVVTDWCRKRNISPSKLFIPLSYAAVLGGLCTLIGTSTTLVVHGLMLQAQRTDPAMPTMGLFTIGAVGLPAALAGIAYLLVAGRWLLPSRQSARSRLADPRQYTVEMVVEAAGPLAGRTVESAGLRHLPGMFLSAIERDGEREIAVDPQRELHGGDQLIFVGVVESIVDLQRIPGLSPATDQVFKLDDERHQRCLIEAVVSDTCPLIGTSVREGRFRTRYNAVVIAVHRNAHRIDQKIGDIVLRPGDTLLLEAHRRFLDQHGSSRDFFLVSDVPNSRPRRLHRARWAVAIAVAMVVAMAFEEQTGVRIFNVALIAAAAMGLAGCVSATQARESIDWSTLVSIGAALAIGRALETTGLAATAADLIISRFAGTGPVGVLAGVYLVTLLLTELVTNNAAAAMAFPLAHAASTALHANFLPFGIAIAIAASAGFATPIGYQTHLMVYGAGGYRFGDYVRIGVPLDLLIMAITVALTPMIFPF
jgi:di/tricarboxylate transporter